MKYRISSLVLGLALAVGANSAFAQYDLSWWTVDGGGGMFSTGGTFELGGTIGQPDAGVMTGGTYELSGGFWPVTASLLGDMNCDGVVDFDDINPFVLALSNPAEYAIEYPNCNVLNADCNSDGVVNFDDINAMVDILSGG